MDIRTATFTSLVWVVCAACDNKTEEDFCVDEPPPNIETPAGLGADANLAATLAVNEWVISRDDVESTQGLIRADFADFSEYEEEKIDAIPFSEACVGEVGQHVINNPPETMTAGQVIFRGLVIGERALEKSDAGVFQNEEVEGAVFTSEGGETILAEVNSSDDALSFPTFVAEVVVPPAIQLNVFDLQPDWSLDVEWEPADTTHFEIVMKAASTNPDMPSNRLRCLMADDGCYVIPAAAIEWLFSQGTEKATVLLKRHEMTYIAATNQALAKLEAMRSLEFDQVL